MNWAFLLLMIAGVIGFFVWLRFVFFIVECLEELTWGKYEAPEYLVVCFACILAVLPLVILLGFAA